MESEDWDKLIRIKKMTLTCNATISTMDDVITYAKIETKSSMTLPSRQPLQAWSFIRDVVRPFTIQVEWITNCMG